MPHRIEVEDHRVTISFPVTQDGVEVLYSASAAPDSYRAEYAEFNLTGSPTGGAIVLAVNGVNTAPIAYNANAAAVKAAVEAVAPAGTVVDAYCEAAGVIAGVYLDIAYPHGTVVTPLTIDASGLTGGTAPDVDITYYRAFRDTHRNDLPVGSLYIQSDASPSPGAGAFRGNASVYVMAEVQGNAVTSAKRKFWVQLTTGIPYGSIA